MKNRGLIKLRLIVGALLLVMTLSAGQHSSAIASFGGVPAAAPEGQTDSNGPPTNQIIIKYRDNAHATDSSGHIKTEKINTLNTAASESLTYQRAMSGDAHVLSLSARKSPAAVEAIARKLAALPDVEYAEPDYIMRHMLVPNDPSYAAQWHYHGPQGINAPAAWDITTGSATVRVAVIDTGITDHPDLAGRWVGGYDFIADIPTANDGNGRDNDPHDPGDWVTANMCGLGEPAENSSWHGTHVAGTIGAASNNGLGVAGINWVSPIVPIRVLGRCGGFTSDIVDGMRWAAGLAVAGVPANANPAKVMNMSLGGSGACSSTYQNAINAINAAGAIVVVAAGNSNSNASGHQPANCNGVVTVAATDRDGNRTFYSNFGSVVEISAPGGETNTNSPSPAPQNGVLSTLNTGLTIPSAPSYVYYQGTSMAAPHIAGVLSLMASLDPTLNFTQSLQLLQSTARAFPPGSSCNTSTCGSGIVDAAAALNAVLNPPGPTFTPTSTSPSGGKPTRTPTPTRTSTLTVTPTWTATATQTGQPGVTDTPTSTPVATNTRTPTPTRKPR
jgi:serine protease